MRIISQDGMIDFPYEYTIVYIDYLNEKLIYAKGMSFIIAKYSTKAKAKKAMEMLRTAYQYAEECKYIGVGSSQPEFCFRFPADEELED